MRNFAKKKKMFKHFDRFGFASFINLTDTVKRDSQEQLIFQTLMQRCSVESIWS